MNDPVDLKCKYCGFELDDRTIGIRDLALENEEACCDNPDCMRKWREEESA